MLAQAAPVAQVFEAAMLICFGSSWPISILKAVRTKHVRGKSLGFMGLIFIGYLFGVTAKCIYAATLDVPLPPVTALYALNGLLVGIDIALYRKYRDRPEPEAQLPEGP